MLREIPVVRQVRGEARRRWFSSTACDLVVWIDDAGAAVGFQLCYDKTGHEHALTWKAGLGFSHMAVDSGEERPLRHKGAPILLANGAFDVARVRAEFLREAVSVPAEFRALVEGKLRELASANP